MEKIFLITKIIINNNFNKRNNQESNIAINKFKKLLIK